MEYDFLSKKQSEELEPILKTIREFVDDDLIPFEEEARGKEFRDLLPELKKRREKAKKLGLWLPQIAKEHGGLGLSLVQHGYVCQELGRSPYGFFVVNCQAPDSGNMEILIDHGTSELFVSIAQRRDSILFFHRRTTQSRLKSGVDRYVCR